MARLHPDGKGHREVPPPLIALDVDSKDPNPLLAKELHMPCSLFFEGTLLFVGWFTGKETRGRPLFGGVPGIPLKKRAERRKDKASFDLRNVLLLECQRHLGSLS